MSKFIEINEHLIDMDEIKTCYYKEEPESSDKSEVSFLGLEI